MGRNKRAERKYLFPRDRKGVTNGKTIKVLESAKVTELKHVNIQGWSYSVFPFILSNSQKSG